MTDEEITALLASAPSIEEPPAGLEARLVARMREERLLPSRRRWPWLAAAAAVLAVVVALWMPLRHREAPAGSAYILLLYEAVPETPHPDRAAEYGRWARRMRPHVTGGEELGAQIMAIGSGVTAPAGSRLAGYFLLQAATDAEAVRIAKACPHLRYGGNVVLRKIERP